MDILPVLLCGGVGKRLWPLSRETQPKQFQNLYNEFSLLQNTLLFSQKIPNSLPPLLVANYHRRFIIEEQLQAINIETSGILLEPSARNTAGAICLASLYAKKHLNDPVIIMLPIDHVTTEVDMAQFLVASKLAAEDYLVTFGIKPESPSTQYGYIQTGKPIKPNVYSVKSFHEKPNLNKATQYLESQQYYWNSGIYTFLTSHILNEFSHLHNTLLQTCQDALNHAQSTESTTIIQAEDYNKVSKISFDYAIAEKSQNIVMQIFSGQWQDIGTWKTLKEIGQADADNNITSGDVYPIYSNNCYVRADGKTVVTLGLEDCYIIETPDALLVTNEKNIAFVNEAFDEVAKYNPEITQFMDTVYRPWGKFETILSENNLRIKKLYIKPLQRLSLQSHQFRTEHWTVLEGTAKVTVDDKLITVATGESIDIPLQAKHRVANEGSEMLVILEIQRGEKILETDITRYEDDYQRSQADF